MTSDYVELHAKSFYSFGVGASHVHELLAQAKEYGYPALALTDTNLCGALEFARLANSLDSTAHNGRRVDSHRRLPLYAAGKDTGWAIRISPGSSLWPMPWIARSRCSTRPSSSDHSEGIVMLAGGRDGQLSRLVMSGHLRRRP